MLDIRTMQQDVTRAGILLIGIIVILMIQKYLLGANPLQSFIVAVDASISLSLLAIAAALVMSQGDIDLSYSGMIAICHTCIAVAPILDLSPALSWFLLCTFGLLLGFFHFLIVHLCRLTSLVTTLATAFMLYELSVFAYTWARQHDIEVPSSYIPTRSSVLYYLALPTIICALLAAWWTPLTIRIRAAGQNSVGAKSVGLNPARIRAVLLAVSALLGVASGFANVAYVRGVTSPPAEQHELLAILAAILGGASLSGGRLMPLSAVCASVLIRQLQICATQMDIPSQTYYTAVGALVLLYAVVASITQRVAS